MLGGSTLHGSSLSQIAGVLDVPLFMNIWEKTLKSESSSERPPTNENLIYKSIMIAQDKQKMQSLTSQ